MDGIDIRPCTVADVERAPNIADLAAEYAAESALGALGPANPQFSAYRQMEDAGVARLVAAFQGPNLVGFVVLLVSVVPHFSSPVASTESFFVAQAARKTGAGLKLLHEAERIAHQSGAVGLFVSAPVGGRLAQVLPRVGYIHTNYLFFRSL